jgi:hypothetical protein
MQKHWNKIEPLTFYALLALWLVPIWYVAFFVTGDGPCHLHNSKILLDWWSGENKALYEQYYTLNPHVDPNWLFNLLTVPLLAIFKPALAEKIYLTMYVLGFGLGFRFMLRQINPNSLFLSSVALLFCQHRLFMMGFCNNSLSFALWFWVAGWWWKNRNDFSGKALLITTLLWFVLYLAHPMGLAFAGMMVVCMAVGLFLFELKEEGFSVSIQKSIRRAYTSILCALPTLFMTYNFIPRRSWSEETNKPNVVDALENIERLSSLNVLNHVEQDLASLVALLCFGFFIAYCIRLILFRGAWKYPCAWSWCHFLQVWLGCPLLILVKKQNGQPLY